MRCKHKGGNNMAELAVGASHNVINPNSLTFEERQRQLESQDKKKKMLVRELKKVHLKTLYKSIKIIIKLRIGLCLNRQ